MIQRRAKENKRKEEEEASLSMRVARNNDGDILIYGIIATLWHVPADHGDDGLRVVYYRY